MLRLRYFTTPAWLLFCFFEIVSHTTDPITLAGLEFTKCPSCLYFLHAEMMGLSHHDLLCPGFEMGLKNPLTGAKSKGFLPGISLNLRKIPRFGAKMIWGRSWGWYVGGEGRILPYLSLLLSMGALPSPCSHPAFCF